MNYFEPGVDPDYYIWVAYEQYIPAEAQTAATTFRWIQFSSSADTFDNWGLDNVSVSAAETVANWNWIIDGTAYTDENPTHTFPTFGNYNVSLTTTTTNGGCSDSETAVHVINSIPTIDAISDQTADACGGTYSVTLTGITDGGIRGQTLNVTATSSNPGVITNFVYDYTSPNADGVLYFDAIGYANSVDIDVTVEYFNLATVQYTTTFTVNMTPDAVPPTGVTQDITVTLAADGTYSLTGDMIDNGSTDDCSYPLTFDVTLNLFTCADIGDHVVDFTVTDASGNSSSYTATVTVVDAPLTSVALFK